MLAVLDLFTLRDSRLTADEIGEQLSLSKTTVYRYLSALLAVGLVARFSRTYVLGPRAIELDQLIRLSDPLLAAADSIMVAESRNWACDVQLLTLAGGHMIVTHHVRSESGVVVSYGRGTTTPPFQGAGAMVIAASLPAARQRQLFARHQRERAEPDPQLDWDEVRRRLVAVRKAGTYISQGELDQDSVGIAAPIVDPRLDNPAAIVLIVPRMRFATIDESSLVASVRVAAEAVRSRLEKVSTSA